MKNKTKHIVLIICFITLLIAPSIVSIAGIEGKIQNTENRNKTNFPKIKTLKNPRKFAREIKGYYNDNFGFRQSLSNIYLQFKSNVLHESPIPNKLIIGKNNFYFLGNSFSNVVNESFGFSLFTKKELLNIKNTVLERKKWLHDRNIKFYIATAPNKHSIYKEYLPFHFLKTKTRKQQVITYLNKACNFKIIDLGKQFSQKKKTQLLYRKHDSHWNNIGAFYAYQTLIEEIKKDFPIKKQQFLDYKTKLYIEDSDGGKLLNKKVKDTFQILTPINKTDIKTLKIPDFYKNKKIHSVEKYKNTAKKYKVLLFRDSFSNALIPYINQTFGECTFVFSHNFDKEIILKEKPDLVIIEYVERYLERLKK